MPFLIHPFQTLHLNTGMTWLNSLTLLLVSPGPLQILSLT